MKLSWFASVILILLLLQVHVFHWAKDTYSDRDLLRAQVHHLTESLHEEELKTLALLDKFEGFQQEVAALLPDQLKIKGKTEEGFSLRALASVTQTSRGANAQKMREAMTNTLFEKGRGQFSEGKYQESVGTLKQFLNQSGYSAKAPEAYLLMVEGLYQEGQLEEAADVIRKMVDLFPGHEVSGFATIRLGKILEDRGRATDAIDLYRTVLKTFTQQEVVAQAKNSLKGVSF